MIKVLHTADWHLGKRLFQCERTEEHQYFLDWLIHTLTFEKIDVLIIAGDIFDTGHPTNTALKQYYDFLWKASETCCREVIIIGGNHDSVATLDAPKDLLKIFNIHVTGGVPDDNEDQIIPVKDPDGKVELVVCAVPFLRDKDVRLSIPGESSSELEARLKQGISDHYQELKEHIIPYKEKKIPVIATGHLYAAGATNSESEKDIHVGNLGRISGNQFPREFDYVALGHLHRPQLVNQMDHIRYSGSPIPLSFSEAEDCKVVLKLEFTGEILTEIKPIAIPPCRKLIRVHGDLQSVKAKIEIITDQKMKLPLWVEVQLKTEKYLHDLQEQLNELISGKPFIENIFQHQHLLGTDKALDQQVSEKLNLTDLDPRSVFKKKCESSIPDLDLTEILQTFDEAVELYRNENC